MEHGARKKPRPDIILRSSIALIILSYGTYLFLPEITGSFVPLYNFTSTIFELMNKMWWGVLLGIFFVGLLDQIPREFIMTVLGKDGKVKGIFRATLAGVLLDLCSHGILLVGMKLYKRGASLGQVMAFLIASPWNSLSLTLILWALVGFKWMIAMLLLSIVIAIISGLIFEVLTAKGVLPKNPNARAIDENFNFWGETKKGLSKFRPTPTWFVRSTLMGLGDSKMILRWIFFGVVLAAAVRTFVSPEAFATFFGPTAMGLLITVIVATLLEVCSEGSLPIAADILTRAGAPGNAFTFLMTGVSTDYTEVLSLKETTRSWKVALFLPLVTVPQVIAIGLILNKFVS